MSVEDRPLATVEIIRRELAKGIKQTEPEIAPYLHAARKIERALREAGHIRDADEILDRLESDVAAE